MAKMSKSDVMSMTRPAALLPDREDYIERAGGRLRYAVWNPRRTPTGTPLGTVVLIQGRAEFIEKYAMEVAGELLARGFAVYAVDLRGQGLSSRILPDHDKGHIDDFATYVADLSSFPRYGRAPRSPPPPPPAQPFDGRQRRAAVSGGRGFPAFCRGGLQLADDRPAEGMVYQDRRHPARPVAGGERLVRPQHRPLRSREIPLRHQRCDP